MSSLLKRVRSQLDGRGQSMVEYALILVLIAIVVMVVVAATRGRLGYTAPTAGGATPTAVDRTVHITAPGGLL